MTSAWMVAMIAIAIFILPGAIIAWCCGTRPTWAVVAGIPMTAGVWGTLTFIFGHLGIPSNAATLLVGTGVLALLLLAVRWALSLRRRRSRAKRKNSASSKDEQDSSKEEAGDSEQSQAVLANRRASIRVGTWDDEEEPERPSRLRRLFGWLAEPAMLAPIIGTIIGVGVLLKRGLGALVNSPHGMDNIFQGWDVHWHSSVIRYAMDTGELASDMMGPLQNYESRAELFYPTGWHAMGLVLQNLTGISPIAAANMTGIILPSVMLPISTALLAWFAVGKTGKRQDRIAGAMAAGIAPIAVTGVLSLYYIGYYVGAWPYLAGMSMVGVSAALFLRASGNSRYILPAAIGFVGVGLMHPSVVTVVGMLVFTWWVASGLWTPVTTRLRDLGRLALALVVALAIMVPQFLAGMGQAEEVQAFTTERDVDRATAWKMVLELQARHSEDFPVDWGLLIAAIVGAVVLLVWRRNLWMPLVYGLLAVIAVHSVKHFGGWVGDAAGAIGALHYNTTLRLIMPLGMLVAIAASVPLVALMRLLAQLGAKRRNRKAGAVANWRGTRWGVWPVLATILAVIAGAPLAVADQKPQQEGYDWALRSSRVPRVIDDQELAAYDWLAKQPGAYDGIIANNPAEGAGWMYPAKNLPALHRHFLWPKASLDSATNMMFWHPDLVGAGLPPVPGSPAARMMAQGEPPFGWKGDRTLDANVADFAAKDLNVKFYITSPPSFFSFQRDVPEQTEGLWRAPGMTPVYKNGHTTIFAVNDQFTDQELLAMRAPGQSPEPLPHLRTKGQFGQESHGDAKDPYFPRPKKWDRDLANRAAEQAAEAEKKAAETKANPKGAAQSDGLHSDVDQGVPRVENGPAAQDMIVDPETTGQSGVN